MNVSTNFPYPPLVDGRTRAFLVRKDHPGISTEAARQLQNWAKLHTEMKRNSYYYYYYYNYYYYY